jgi:hypothetical protein
LDVPESSIKLIISSNALYRSTLILFGAANLMPSLDFEGFAHFGISSQGRVKFLDLDSMFAKSILGKTMRQQGSLDSESGNCTQHADCSFFDCQGECDLIAGICRENVANNNLQVVCEKVFLGRQSIGIEIDIGWVFKENGFLTSKHANSRLTDLLQKCANPSKSKDGIRLAAPNKIKVDLYKALEEIINFMEDSGTSNR